MQAYSPEVLQTCKQYKVSTILNKSIQKNKKDAGIVSLLCNYHTYCTFRTQQSIHPVKPVLLCNPGLAHAQDISACIDVWNNSDILNFTRMSTIYPEHLFGILIFGICHACKLNVTFQLYLI